MMNFIYLMDWMKEHWEKVSVLVATAFETALAFQQTLAEISLGTRFLIGGLVSVLATLSVAEMLRKEPRRSVGFENTADDPMNPTKWYVVRIFAILLICTLSVFLLREILTFHNIRVVQSRYSGNRLAGILEIQPAHRAVSLTVNVATSQSPPVEIAYMAPSSWNDADPVNWTMQDQSPFGVTFMLRDFRSPQVFGLWYKLSGDPLALEVDVNSDPPEVRVIRGPQLEHYRLAIWIFGGGLCALGLLFWSYRSAWFRPNT